jgi:hypothetical protein
MEAAMTPDDPRSAPAPVATGDRRGEAHLEPDPDGGVRAHFLRRPETPPPPDEHTGRVDQGRPAEQGAPVEDLRVAPDSPSSWDARPPADRADSAPSPVAKDR